VAPLIARLGMLLLALPCLVGAGVALAQLRARNRATRSWDPTLLSAVLALLAFGALSTAAGAGLLGVAAFGLVTVWASYVVAAQRAGLFRIETVPRGETAVAEPQSRR
jgi:hypothetical protein